MRASFAAAMMVMLACGGTDPSPGPTPQPQPPSQPQPQPTACFLEQGGHGDWLYHFERVEGNCGPGTDFVSNMAPGTSFIHTGPIPKEWDCETLSNVVSSDRCQKNISRRCNGTTDFPTSLVEEFHQESPTRVTFSLDERWDAPPFAFSSQCSGRYYGTITKQ